MPSLALLKAAHKVTQCYYKTWQAYSEQAEHETALAFGFPELLPHQLE